MTLQEIKTAVSELDPIEQAHLAEHLYFCMGQSAPDEIKTEWLELAKLRLDEMRSGKVVWVPADEVLGNLLVPIP